MFRKTMGDVDVLYHDGVYHLFHLVLPNHDFIAHAISRDGLNWERVENALFIGHPGGWDDHMLWTMHISPDPHRRGGWRMFYTGLSRSDGGAVQRIGMATSDDLYHWRKVASRWEAAGSRRADGHEGVASSHDPKSPFPLTAQPPYYEHSTDEGRGWVSWRDPFFFEDEGRRYLLTAGRVCDGPVIRRGCVGLTEETQRETFCLRSPLHHPGQYDDIEVPNLLKLGGRYYLIASIREDAKVRYWYADSLRGPWRNFYDNVLLPRGNYAARVCIDDSGPMLWNFYTNNIDDRLTKNLMPPPKRLGLEADGRLKVKSFEKFSNGFEEVGSGLKQLLPLQPVIDNRHAGWKEDPQSGTVELVSEGGFEAFLFAGTVESFRMRSRIRLDGAGKCGLLFRTDPATSNGYHLSLDLMKGLAQLRAWGERPGGRVEHAFDFRSLQAGYWRSNTLGPLNIQLLAFGSYIEFSIDDRVILTLADETYHQGRLGFYVETSTLQLQEVHLTQLRPASQPGDDLPGGQNEDPQPISPHDPPLL